MAFQREWVVFVVLLVLILSIAFYFGHSSDKVLLNYIVHEDMNDLSLRSDVECKGFGYYIDSLNQPNAPYYYIITMGPKNTGGFYLKVQNVSFDDDENVLVTVQEIFPDTQDNVTDALTCPSVVIEFSHAPRSIIIQNQEGVTYPYLG